MTIYLSRAYDEHRDSALVRPYVHVGPPRKPQPQRTATFTWLQPPPRDEPVAGREVSR